MNAKRSMLLANVYVDRSGIGCGLCRRSEPPPQQSYPNRPIKLVVPIAAGGPSRHHRAGHRRQAVGQPQAAVRDRESAGRGRQHRNRIRRQGRARRIYAGLVLGTTLTVNPSLYKKLPFDPDKDFRPISIVTTTGNMLVVHPSIPVNSVAEFVAYAKAATARKEPIAYASGGNGTPGHLAMENFRVARRVRGDPCALSRQCADGHRSRGRAGQGRFRHQRRHDGSCAGGPPEGARRIACQPLAARAGRADDRRVGLSRFQRRELYRDAGAGRNSGADRRAARSAKCRPRSASRCRRAVSRDGRVAGRDHRCRSRARLQADRAEWAKVVAAANMRLD